MNTLRKDREGETYTTNEGCLIKITEYNSRRNCTIEFVNNSLILYNVEYQNIKKGGIKNPFHPSVYGVGFTGVGKHKPKEIKKYNTWKGMLERCYRTSFYKKQPTYKDVTVCEEWHNYQNFAAWYEDNYIDGWHLDKDLLLGENKIYSPSTCTFVPREINNLFTKRQNDRGVLPIGVTFLKGKFQARINKSQTREFLGYFNTPEEAFEAYKTAKEEYIKEVADKWKDQLDPRVYEAMYNYEVKITD